MKKCIVLDLDDTLWGGVVGEEGIGGISLGLTPPGSNFLAFQQSLLDLHNNGIILAINSKNNFDDAMAVIKNHPFMVLRENNFAAVRMNWNDKTENFRELSKELNIGLDSMVFFDNDPINRSFIKSTLPEVEVPDLPEDSSRYVSFLNSLPYFKGTASTDEDKMRGSYYVTERIRKEHEKKFKSKEDFLKSLETEVNCFINDTSNLNRLSQLTGKTNQFNTNKRPFSEEGIKNYSTNPEFAVFHADAGDRFGRHGIIAFALVKKGNPIWTIESLLLSCRVLGRGIEESFLESIRIAARKEGAESLRIIFEATEKNKPAQNFIGKYFKDYLMPLSPHSIAPDWIRMKFHEKS